MVEMKCVIVVDSDLPPGLIANTASVIGVSLGRRAPHMVAEDLPDQAGRYHAGLINITLPILGAKRDWINAKREELFENPEDRLIVIDFSAQAQIAKTLEDYRDALAAFPAKKIRYLGLGLYGPKAVVNRHTKPLRLLR